MGKGKPKESWANLLIFLALISFPHKYNPDIQWNSNILGEWFKIRENWRKDDRLTQTQTSVWFEKGPKIRLNSTQLPNLIPLFYTNVMTTH